MEKNKEGKEQVLGGVDITLNSGQGRNPGESDILARLECARGMSHKKYRENSM